MPYRDPEKRRAAQAAYRERNKERAREWRRTWYAKNREKADEASKKWARENREHLNAKRRAKHAANPGASREYQRKVYAKHAERYRKASLDWYYRNRDEATRKWREKRLENPDYHRKRIRAWHEKNPGAAVAYNVNRRHRLRAQKGKGLTAQEWRDIKASFCDLCAYCLKPLKLQRDHVEALMRGGLNEAENVVPACAMCNASKGKRSLLVWLRNGGRAARCVLDFNVGVTRAA